MATMEKPGCRSAEQDESEAESCASSSQSQSTNPNYFLDKVRQSNEAIHSGDFRKAVSLYTEAITLDPGNHILYSNRSAAYTKLGQHEKALGDARKARELNPTWSKAYYREGVALQSLGKDADALAAFASGLAADPKSTQLLNGMVEAAMKSPLKEKFGPVYAQLVKMKLDHSPFVVISVIGQELLSAACFAACLVVLESALRIGTCSLKLRGSVFSALSSAHWGLGFTDKAIACMLQDLAIAKSLGDQEGQCRAHGNLGASYFSKGNYKEALTHHRFQLVLAMRLKDRTAAAVALSSLGHVYTAIGDYPNALASHKQCVLVVKQDNDRLQEAREIGNVGAVYLAMGDFDSALECHNEHLKIGKHLKNRTEEARAYSNLGSAHHYKRDYEKAIYYHNEVLKIAQELNDRTLEARAYAGLGHASRCKWDYQMAKHFHEKQLDNALQTKDKVAEGRACSNLGIIYQLYGEYDAALKLQKAQLNITKELGDRASQGRAYGNIGNAYSSMGEYELAVRFHKQELAISKEVNDRHSEASTHGNLAVAYQALGVHDKALLHYNLHLKMTRELRDTVSEARALSNLGNYHSSRKDFTTAIPFYEQYLIISQEIHDVEGEGKACHKLGYAHYCLGNYKEAIRYYEQDLALAKDQQDKTSMSRAYCNLGLAYKALGDYPKALECQKYFMATAHMTQNMAAKFCALGNIGDVLIKLGELQEAVKMFTQQLTLAKHLEDRRLEGTGHGNLGSVYRLLGMYDKALAQHTQELTIFQEINDVKGECRAHGNVGNVHMSLGKYSNAYRSYEEQLDRSRDLKDSIIEAQAYGNLGITKMNMSHFDDAIGLFEQQLALLEQGTGPFVMLDKGRAFGNLGDCYEALGDFEESVKCHEQYLAIAFNSGNTADQDKAYRGLGNAHRAMGNLQQALVCFEKRLVVAHELDKPAAKGSAYGELGCLHSLLGNFEQAISCLQNQLKIAREIGDKIGEGDAACGLGGVYQQMAEYEKALEYHQLDLGIAEETGNAQCQCRAYGNLGLSHESLGNFEKAISYQEEHLSIAAQISDKGAKTLAYSSLGRVHHAIGNYRQAVQYLQQGLQIAEQLARREDEAKIRHRLGLALWGHGDLEESQQQLYRAADYFESIRREAQISSDYKLSLFDLQTASYQALQRVLVALGRTDDALVVAERGRTRAFVDLLVERQRMGSDSWYNSIDSTPVTKEMILDIASKQKAVVLYFSIAAGFLYSWLIVPDKGIVKFHECSVSELEVGSDPEDSQSMKSLNVSTTSLLDQFVGHVRESLGVESHLSSSKPSLSRSSFVMSETESEADDLWQQHLEEIGDKLNSENDRTGFLRMVNRNHIFNSSSYSVSSLLSLGSFNGLAALRGGSMRSNKSQISGKPPLSALYDLLIAPMEEALPQTNGNTGYSDLVLVLQGDLYLVPFSVLKGTQGAQCLYERYNLIVAPSIRGLQASQALSRHNKYNPDCTGAVLVSNPKLPQCVTDQWQWGPLPGTEQECKMLGELLGSKPLTGTNASKENVLRQIQRSEVLHFATHVSWKLTAIVLSPGEFSSATTSVHGNLERMDLNESSSDLNSSFEGPPLSDFLLSAADVLNVKITARLVVLSSGHSDDRSGRINSDGVVGLTRAFLAAGAQCVLFSLWPVPEMATKMLLKAFFSALLKGLTTSRALAEAMRIVQNTRQFAHPANWACWMLVGSDVKLSSKIALMGHALCQLLKNPSRSREAMRVVLHLVEKSLQRIHQGQRNAMYTTQTSIENKVGDVVGWKDLLTSVGFRFEAPSNGIPASVFFPTSDPGDRLTQCSASLQALLGLAIPTLTAMSKILGYQDVGEAVTSLVRDVNKEFNQDASVIVPISVKLWRAPGCHEFLASLGFDLIDVGKDEVKVKAGKQANRRTLQFALQALVAIFDTQDAPRTLFIDSSSSMESLCSSGSATSTSNFSKGSSPPGSPTGSRRKSFFNPAEVDKLPSAAKVKQTQGSKGRGSSRPQGSNISLNLNHQNAIRAKYSSPSSTSEDNDPSQSDDQNPRHDCSLPGKHDIASDSSEKSARGRSGQKGLFPEPPTNIYSTSASDSEDNEINGGGTLTRATAARSSVLSTSSTITLRSLSSSGGFRRNRVRSSQASTKSSASDKTLTGDTEQYCFDTPGEGGSETQHRGSHGEKPSKDNVRRHEYSGSQDGLWSADDLDYTDPKDNKQSAAHSMLLDPTVLAQKVLAETRQERMALEHMQRLSIHTEEKTDPANTSSDTDLQNSTSGIGSSLSSPQTSSSSSAKPVGCVAPNVQTRAKPTPDDTATLALKPVDSQYGGNVDVTEGVSSAEEMTPDDPEFRNKLTETPSKVPVSALKQDSLQSNLSDPSKIKPPVPSKPKTVKFSDVVQENALTPEPERSGCDSSLDSSTPYQLPEDLANQSTPKGPPPPYGANLRSPNYRQQNIPIYGEVHKPSPQGVPAKIVRTPQAVQSINQYSMSAQSEPVNVKQMVSTSLPSKQIMAEPLTNSSPGRQNTNGSIPNGQDRLKQPPMAQQNLQAILRQKTIQVQQQQQQQKIQLSNQMQNNKHSQLNTSSTSALISKFEEQGNVGQNGGTGTVNIYGQNPQFYKPPPPYPGPRLPGGAAGRPASLSSSSGLPSPASSIRSLNNTQTKQAWYDSKSSDSEMSAILESPTSEGSSQRSSLYDGSGLVTGAPISPEQMGLRYDLPNHSTSGHLDMLNYQQGYIQGVPFTNGSWNNNDKQQGQSQYGGLPHSSQGTPGKGFVQNSYPASGNTVEIVSGPDHIGYSSESDVYGSNSTISLPPMPMAPPPGKPTQQNGRESPVYENLKWFSDIGKQSSYTNSRHSQSPVSTGSVHSQSSSFGSSGYPASQPQYTTQSKPPPYNHALYTRQQSQALPRPTLSPGHSAPHIYPQKYSAPSGGPPVYNNRPPANHKPAYELSPPNLTNQRQPYIDPSNTRQGYSDQPNQNPNHLQNARPNHFTQPKTQYNVPARIEQRPGYYPNNDNNAQILRTTSEMAKRQPMVGQSLNYSNVSNANYHPPGVMNGGYRSTNNGSVQNYPQRYDHQGVHIPGQNWNSESSRDSYHSSASDVSLESRNSAGPQLTGLQSSKC